MERVTLTSPSPKTSRSSWADTWLILPSRVKFQVDTGKLRINDALHIIDAENLEDINISNVPLESIITEIYKAEGREDGIS